MLLTVGMSATEIQTKEDTVAKAVEEGYRYFIRNTDVSPVCRQYRMDFAGSVVGGRDYGDYLVVTKESRRYHRGRQGDILKEDRKDGTMF